MTSALWNLLFLLVALGILVTIHEAGHFFAARLCKVKVLRFSIGFGKPLFKFTGKDGCQYTIATIPLGGFVQMLGEGKEDESSKFSKEQIQASSFKYKTKLQRAFIIGAGPLSNILLSIIIYMIIAMHGVTSVKPVVGTVLDNSLAQSSGLMTYDLIKKVDGKDVDSWSNTILSLVSKAGSNVNLTVAGDIGSNSNRDLLLNLKGIDIDRSFDFFTYFGFSPCYGRESREIDKVIDNSPAHKAGIKKGDIIVSVDGIKITSFLEFTKIINTTLKPDLEFVVSRDGTLYKTTVYPSHDMPKEMAGQKRKVFVGIAIKVDRIDGLYSTKEYDFVDSIGYAINTTYQVSTFIVKSIALLISGAISPDSISGPIGIAKAAGDSAGFGFISFLGFLAVISVNLGIFNLLPVPVLDGGQLMFIAYEAITKKEPSEKVRYMLTMLGLGVLFALTIFAVFNDIQSLL